MNLKDLCLESNDLTVSYQTQQVLTLANLLYLPQLPTRKTFGKEPLVYYFSSHVVTFNQYLVVLKKKEKQRGYGQSRGIQTKQREGKKIKKLKIHLP
jgi:hypothetical protein